MNKLNNKNERFHFLKRSLSFYAYVTRVSF